MGKYQPLLDQMFKCEICKYYTCNKRDFERHLKTKRCITKHLEMKEKEKNKQPSNHSVNRVTARDEFDDFVSNEKLSPTSSTESIPGIIRDPSKDSIEQTRIRNKKKTQKPKQSKTDDNVSLNMKKTSSGDNIVIGHIELDELIVPNLNTKEEKHDVEDNHFYQTIYTQPLLLQKYLPIVYGWCIKFGKNCVKFMGEMFSQAGSNPTQTEHDS